MNPELIFYNKAKLLEAPYYDKSTEILYFVAIRYNTIFALNTKTLAIMSYPTEGPVGGVIPDENGNLIECEKSGIYKLNPSANTKELICHINPNPKMRYNHIIMDSMGRLLIDIMGDEERSEGKGGLYSYFNGESKCLVFGTTVANGLALSNDEKKLYFTDTVTRLVWEYDYDISTGEVSNQRTVVTTEGDGKPDGLCIDSDGMLWVTEWAGGKVCRYNPATKEKLSEIRIPSTHATACCIGGDNNEYLYVTSAMAYQNEDAPAGGIFRIKVN